MKKLRTEEKAITLIALVVTITTSEPGTSVEYATDPNGPWTPGNEVTVPSGTPVYVNYDNGNP